MRPARGDVNEVAAIGVCRQLAVGARSGDGHHLRMRGGEMRRGDRGVAGGAVAAMAGLAGLRLFAWGDIASMWSSARGTAAEAN